MMGSKQLEERKYLIENTELIFLIANGLEIDFFIISKIRISI